MPLTKDFRETIRGRAQRDASFRRALLREAVELLLSGDVEAGQGVMRNYINATVGFRELSERVRTPEKSLMRMFRPQGNPQSKTMFGVIAELAKAEGVNFSLKTKPALVYALEGLPPGSKEKLPISGGRTYEFGKRKLGVVYYTRS